MEAREAWSKIAGNAIMKRAIEIAMLGHHVVAIMGHPDNGAMYAQEILGKDNCHALPECPCGNFGDTFVKCYCSTRKIKLYRGDVYASEVYRRTEMFVQSSTPNWDDYQRSVESFGFVMGRIGGAKYPEDVNFNKSSQELMAKAISGFGLRVRQVHNVIAVAHTISALARVESIAIEHVAEAIQYQRPWGNS